MAVEAKIYVAPLSDYSEGNDYGKWFEFSNYPDGETLLAAIKEFLQEIQDNYGGKKRTGYIVTDTQGFPNWFYSEYMNQKSFDDVYRFIDLNKDYDSDAIEGFVNFGHNLSRFQSAYYGKFKNANDFAVQFVESIKGIRNLECYENYLYISDVDRRILAEQEADRYITSIEEIEDGCRLIKEGGQDVNKYKSASEADREILLSKAKERLSDRIISIWYKGLDDAYDFLVTDKKYYRKEQLVNLPYIHIDYDAIAKDQLINNYFALNKGDGKFYVFRRI